MHPNNTGQEDDDSRKESGQTDGTNVNNNAGNTFTRAAKTGDSSNITLWLMLLELSSVVPAGMLKHRNKRKQEQN